MNLSLNYLILLLNMVDCKAVKIQEETFKLSPDHPMLGKSYHNLSAAYLAKKDLEQAYKHCIKALNIQIKAFGLNTNHPDIALSYINLAGFYGYNREYKKAIDYLERALEIQLIIYEHNPRHPCIAIIYQNLGEIYTLNNNYNNAINYFEKALVIKLIIHKNNQKHPEVSRILNNLEFLYEQNKTDFYLQEASELFSLYSQMLIMPQQLTRIVFIQLAHTAFLNDDMERASCYFSHVDPVLRDINFNSKEFIEFELVQAHTAYVHNILSVSISSYSVLLKLDPQLKYGNYYYNLACNYACVGDIILANNTFIKALNQNYQPISASLHIEYAYFLSKYSDILHTNAIVISKHLYATINCEDNSKLIYCKTDKDMVCSVLKQLILENESFVILSPQLLAYYLLLKHQEYINETDSVNNLITEFCQAYNLQEDEFTSRLLEDLLRDYFNKSSTQLPKIMLETFNLLCSNLESPLEKQKQIEVDLLANDTYQEVETYNQLQENKTSYSIFTYCEIL